ncbi:MAG TPA: ATP synthase F0 subunit C [Dehalococcoidia bacterium]|nr:ATP synthase F0 subunit C [Dehalococcoidia bacterium]
MELLLAILPPVVEALRAAAQEQTNMAFTDEGLRFLAAGMSIAFGVIAPALAIGNLVGKAMEALGRNPEAQPAIQTNMILGLAFAEALGIYALVTAVMIGFVF